MEERRLLNFVLLVVLAGSGVFQVSGMTVYTPEEVEAVNGTDVKLKCTFESTEPILPSIATVTWNFQPLEGGSEESVFYFQEQAYPVARGRFKGQVDWVGDIARGDASIMLRNVKFTFNGTFSCHVKNPPDVHGTAGELVLKVVQTASFSEIAVLATAVGCAIGVVLIILTIFVSCKFCRQRSLEREQEMSPQWESKDPSVCNPEDTLPLKLREEMESDSADEAGTREISSREYEKRSLEVLAHITTDTGSMNSDVIPAEDVTTITANSNDIPVPTDADTVLATNDTDAVPKEETEHPSIQNEETTEKTKPAEEIQAGKGDQL